MGRYTGTPVQLPVQTQLVPVGGVVSVFRSGSNYKAVGELVSRASYPDLSTAFPRVGAFSSRSDAAIPTGSQVLNSVAYGNGVFVAVGSTIDRFSVSSDGGKTWAEYPAPASGYQWTSITFGGGLFVAVSKKTGGSNVVATSPDGITWASRTISSSAMWSSVVYGSGVFVAVAEYDSTGSGTTTIAASSPDGITWTARTLPTLANWTSVAFNGGIFLAISVTTAAATSTNGTSWTARTMPVTGNSGANVSPGASSIFVLCLGSSGLYTTTDGVTYTQRVVPYGHNPSRAAYGNGVYVVLTSESTQALISYDAVNWSKKTTNLAACYCITYGAGTFIAFPLPQTNVAFLLYAENITDSDYLYLSGSAGQFVRVK